MSSSRVTKRLRCAASAGSASRSRLPTAQSNDEKLKLRLCKHGAAGRDVPTLDGHALRMRLAAKIRVRAVPLRKRTGAPSARQTCLVCAHRVHLHGALETGMFRNGPSKKSASFLIIHWSHRIRTKAARLRSYDVARPINKAQLVHSTGERSGGSSPLTHSGTGSQHVTAIAARDVTTSCTCCLCRYSPLR